VNKLKTKKMIDLNKEYKTTEGNFVKLFEIYEGLIIGMVLYGSSSPYPTTWELNGTWEAGGANNGFDLVEVKQPIEHSAWVNVYEWGFSRYIHNSIEAADEDALVGRLDCIEVNYSSVK